jgi:hypothetical protein
VEAVRPYTEAADVGVLVSTLVGFGNAVGRGPFVQVGATCHRANENVVLVGPTATGRKGDGMNVGLRPLRLADTAWAKRVCRGFGSGEAIVAELAPPDGDADDPDAPPPVVDNRLLVHEDELAMRLAVAVRSGSTLSPLLRSAWDGTRLENRTRTHGALVAEDAHVSVLSAITPEELIRRVPETEIANGLVNRFLIVGVRRQQLLPSGPPIPGDIEAEYAEAFSLALLPARTVGQMRRDPEAAELWEHAYEHELSIERFGLAGAACSRAEAHALRVSIIYALLDAATSADRSVIRRVHVEAALALWRHCEQSAQLVFGERLGDRDADLILDELARAAGQWVTRTQLRDLFSRHRSAAELDGALAALERTGLIESERQSTGGRPALRYRIRGGDESAVSDESPPPTAGTVTSASA